MFTPEGFQQFTDRIQTAFGLTDEVAGHYASAIGDTPLLCENLRAYCVYDPMGRPTMLPVDILKSAARRSSLSKRPFSLRRGKWYWAEFFNFTDYPDNAPEWYSPVRIHQWKADEGDSEDGWLSFFHANYPEGVQDKAFPCRIVARTGRFLLLARLEDETRFQHICLKALTWKGMEKIFPEFTRSLRSEQGPNGHVGRALDARFSFSR